MAETTPKRSRAAKAPATRKRTAPAAPPASGIDKTAKVSEDVLESLEAGQRAAIEAVRNFVDTVDHALPALPHGEGPSRRREIVDSAMEMADRLVHTQYDFIRRVIDTAGAAMSGQDDETSGTTKSRGTKSRGTKSGGTKARATKPRSR